MFEKLSAHSPSSGVDGSDSEGISGTLGHSSETQESDTAYMSPIDPSIDSTLSALEGLPVDDPRKYRLTANLGRFFLLRFEHFGHFSDIDKSVSVTGEAIQLIPEGHPTDKAICLSNLSDLLFIRSEHFGILADLDESISAREVSAALTPDHDPNKLDRLAKLGNSLSRRFHNSGELADLNKCISTRERIMQLIPEDDSEKYIHLNNLADSFYIRFKQLSHPDDLNNCISAGEEAVRLLPDTHVDRPGYLSNLGSYFFQRFQQSGMLPDVDKSICMLEDAVRLIQDGNPLKTIPLQKLQQNLGYYLRIRFHRVGNLADLFKSITLTEESLRFTPDDHPSQADRLDHLGCALLTRYQHFGDLPDLEKSFSAFRDAVRLEKRGPSEMAEHLTNLSNSLSLRFDRFGDRADIDEAVAAREQTMHLTPDCHPEKPRILSNLGTALLRRFQRFSDISDISRSIVYQKSCVRLAPDHHPEKWLYFTHFGESLLARYEQLSDINDIKDSITANTAALKLVQDGHASKFICLNNLGRSYLNKFQHVGDIKDINEAILHFEAVLELSTETHPDRVGWLRNLGSALWHRFQRLGNIPDIDKSISLGLNAVQLSPDDHRDKPACLTTLATSLFSRFERLGDSADIDRSITAREEAVRIAPENHPEKHVYLNNLGNALSNRFQQHRKPLDIDNAIQFSKEAVRLTPQNHPNKAACLNNIGKAFFYRFEDCKEVVDITESINAFEEAIRLVPDGHASKSIFLTNLGGVLHSRFELLHEKDDVQKAISVRRVAVQLTPDGHAAKPLVLLNLGLSIFNRFKVFGDQDDLASAILQFSAAARSGTGSPSLRFRACLLWARSARHASDASILDAYTVALELLPQLAWLGLSLQGRYRELTSSGSMARDAAAAAIEFKRFQTAVEWLEQGRSIVWGQLLQLRTPVNELQDSHPTLASRLLQVSRELEQSSTSTRNQAGSETRRDEMSLEEHAQRHRALTIEWQEIIQKIRSSPGSERFLLPKTIAQLSASAHSGSVVILNASRSRCDALVITANSDTVLHAPLTEVTYKRLKLLQNSLTEVLASNTRVVKGRATRPVYPIQVVRNPNDVFESILSELWTKVVKPVLNVLYASDLPPLARELPRIFWCPTGPFTSLPIHAAGLHGLGQSNCVLFNWAVSSYTPTLSALLQPSHPDVATSDKLLAIVQPSAPGQTPLPGTIEELKCIQARMECTNVSLTLLKGSEATVASVLEKMKASEASWVHFACHGVQDIVRPTDSGLMLSDGLLKLSDIIKVSRMQGGLAFLSACQTATGDKALSEEAIHLAAGMLLAGYGGVIATMWSIKDSDAPLVADKVYGRLFQNHDGHPDYRSASRALHDAVQSLRAKSEKSYLSWVPFIHIGI